MQLYADPTELTAQVSALLAGEAEPSVFLLRLGLLLSSCGDDSITRLRSDLQEVFGEEMAQADRPLALQLWDQLCRRCPDWSWARLLACDLALQAEQLELCHHHIEAAPETERRSSSCRRRCAAGMRQSSRPAPRASSSGPLPWSTAAMPPAQCSDPSAIGHGSLPAGHECCSRPAQAAASILACKPHAGCGGTSRRQLRSEGRRPTQQPK